MSEIDKVNVWLDKEGNFLDVTWGFGHTYYAATEDNRVYGFGRHGRQYPRVQN